MKTIFISLENDLCNNLCTVFETGNRLFTPSRISRHRVQTIRRFLTMASVTNNVEETYDHDRAAEKTVTVTMYIKIYNGVKIKVIGLEYQGILLKVPVKICLKK